MALGRGQHPCGFAIGLAEVAVGGAGYEAAGAVAVLHAGEQIGKILGCEREIVAHRRQGAALAILVDHAIEDQARDQRLGFLVPMRLAALPCGIVDQSIGQRHGVFSQIEAFRV